MGRIAVVVTSRPSYSRIKSALVALRDMGQEFYIIPAASACLTRYGNVEAQIAQDFPGHYGPGIPGVVEGGGTMESALSTGLLLTQMSSILGHLHPDMVVTIADRHETMATAIAASYQNIPLCHIQGGEVSGSIDDKVRNAITQLADLHLVATKSAAYNVRRMKPGAHVHVTGCPSLDLAAEAIELGPIEGPEVVVLQHPVTTEVDEAGEQMQVTVEALQPWDDVLWFWPGEDAGSDAMSKQLRLAGLKPKRNLPPVEFLRTLLGAKALVGNSSVGIRECSFMGVPVVNIGTRQSDRESGPNVVHVGHEVNMIRGVLQLITSRPSPPVSHLYGDGKAGERIARVLSGEAVEAAA